MEMVLYIIIGVLVGSGGFAYYKYLQSTTMLEELVEVIDELYNYSTMITLNARNINSYFISKLKGGFLQDNEDVRELYETMKEYINENQKLIDTFNNDYNYYSINNDPDQEETIEENNNDTVRQ